jgi:hypothetical protein
MVNGRDRFVGFANDGFPRPFTQAPGRAPAAEEIRMSKRKSPTDDLPDQIRLSHEKLKALLKDTSLDAIRVAPDGEVTVGGFRLGRLLLGAKAIAAYFDHPDIDPRSIFNLVEKSNFPYFRWGGRIATTDLYVDAWITGQVERNTRKFDEPEQDDEKD